MAKEEDIYSTQPTTHQNCLHPFSKEMYGLNEITKANQNKSSMEEQSSLSDNSSGNYCNGNDSFRNNLKRLLHSYRFHLIIVGLVIIDCIIVVVELMIDLEIFRTEAEAGAGHGVSSKQDHSLNSHSTAKIISEVLHYTSIAILCLFSIEIIFKVYAFRMEYFEHKFEVFDAFIVFVSLILDLVFLNHEDVLRYIGLVIVLRLWRIIRVVHGIAISVATPLEHNYEKEKKKREKLDKELAEIHLYVNSLEIEIMNLRSHLTKNNIKDLPQTYLKIDRKV